MTSVFFTSPPQEDEVYRIGEAVEAYCDHDDEEGNRVRGWLRGVVVQANEKLVAVQFEHNVYLTNGWMVPDHILWYPQRSQQLRRPRRRRRRPR